ncbi:hypothetical protein B9Z55_028094 [Caenorhabditis nigoni]|uniref:Uncharacterized protein n=1 Tax=Caenorhabditis nigoni TaxID=1611254 RepID=A0A2G5SDM5_9PELO|nr:hypothetical protein B9Z55_028086 [Caenorhabditis nigoni]PIC13019.1 hypothetical protein B9Z55_028094 [Caenorhabditis nigoni]
MSRKFVACDAVRESKNRAYAFANQLIFKHALVQHSWATLDIDDESTREYINRMEISELERMKFEADVLANNIQPSIKFLKAEDNPLPFVVKLRAPRGCGNFNPQYQQRNNNWTGQNFAQEQNYDYRADTYQALQHSNYPMQQYSSGPSQAVPPMAVPFFSAPVRYVLVNHGYNNTCSTAPMRNGYSPSNLPNGGYYQSPTDSRDSGVYTSSPSNGYNGSQNIQYIPASYPSDVPYASVYPPGESQIYNPSQGVPPQSADFNYPMQQYYVGPSQAVPPMAVPILSAPVGFVPVIHGYNNTCSTAPMQNGYSQSNQPNGDYYPSPTESRDSGVYTSSPTNGSEGCQNVQQVLASSSNDVPYASAIPPEVPQIHDPSPSRSRRQNAHRKKQTVIAKPLIRTTIKGEPNNEKKGQIVSGQHKEPQMTVKDDNGNQNALQQVSKDVATLPVALKKPAESLESTNFDTEKVEKQDTSNEATVTVAKQRNSEPVLPIAPESAEFVEEVKPPSIGTPVENNIRTTTEFELGKESPIVTDNVFGASNRDLNSELSKLDKPVQSTETTAECDIQTTTKLPVEMSEIFVLQQEKPQSVIGMENGKNDQKLKISQAEDVDSRPNVAEDMSGASNTESDPSKLEKPVMSTPIKPSDFETEEHKGHTTSDDGATEPNISEFIDEMVEDPEFPALASKALDSVEKCSNNADVAVVEKEKPSKPLMSEVLLAAIKKDKGTANPCWNAVPIVQQYSKQMKNKNLTDTDGMTTKSQGSKAASSSEISKSQEPFHNKKPEVPKNQLSAKQEQDSNSGWKTVKSSSKDTNNTEKLTVPAEQPPVAKDSKKNPSSEKQKALTSAPSISPTLKTEQQVKENLAESNIDKPDQPEKSQVSKSSQNMSMKNKKKDKKAKTAKASVVEDFDTLLEQFKEEDKKSAEKNGKVGEAVLDAANGHKKKRTIRQYKAEKCQYEAEKEETVKNDLELIDSFEAEQKRLETCVNFCLPLFFVELDDCVKNRSPMFNWPECPVRDSSESEESTRDRDELVLQFINTRIADHFTTCTLQDSFYNFLGRQYNSNLGPVLEPLAKIRLEREMSIDDDWELMIRMLNKREHRAEWNELNYDYMSSSDENPSE